MVRIHLTRKWKESAIAFCFVMQCVFLLSCTNNPPIENSASTEARESVHWKVVPATENEMKLAKAKVTDKLKDPNSAIFGDIWALEGSNGHRSVCGLVNAKNSFGGYTGDRMFSIIDFSSPYGLMMQEGIVADLFPKICSARTVT